jgi:hypothetical protein
MSKQLDALNLAYATIERLRGYEVTFSSVQGTMDVLREAIKAEERRIAKPEPLKALKAATDWIAFHRSSRESELGRGVVLNQCREALDECPDCGTSCDCGA